MKIVSVRLMGGLGNMLFQISTAFSLSLRDNKDFICDTNHMIIPHKPYSEYVHNIFRKINFSNNIKDLQNYSEKNFSFSDIPNIDYNVRINGYFQSEKYFKNHRNEILSLFEIDCETENYLVDKYNSILSKDTCSLHVRRGDYVRLNEHHPVQPIDYYHKSIKIIGEDKHYLIFSDDIMWCEKNFDFIKNKTFISSNSDYQDLYLMTMCNNNIIANSTFSWWGAWMNTNENKKVISPKLWFGNYSTVNTEDLYCENWIKL